MRALVVSDSHNNYDNIQAAIDDAGKVDMLIHLGDVGYNYRAVSQMLHVSTYVVRGNCDSTSELMDRNIIRFGDHQIYATHGHRQSVNNGLNTLRYVALQNNCDIALFGHTHVPYLNEGEDVTFFNPGSVSNPRQKDGRRSYGILTLTPTGRVKYDIRYLD